MSTILAALSRKLGEPHHDTRGWLHFWCPFDQHKAPKLGINLPAMRFNCISCHKSGWITDLLQELGIHLEWGSQKRRPYKAPVLPVPPSEIPGFKRFVDTHDGGVISTFLKDCLAYAKRRGGLTLTDLAERGWGYIPYGFYGMRMIIPIYQDGQLVQFLARSIYDFLEPKELPGQIKDGWWPKSEVAYGLDDVSRGDDVVLVEGPWDKVAMDPVLNGYAVVALLGSHLSAGVCGRILAKKPRRVVLFLDGDEAGRAGTVGCVEILKRRRFKSIYCVKTPGGKDPDELVSEAPGLVKSAIHWMRPY